MKTSLKIICPVASVLSLLVIFAFRSVPQGRLWKKYSVLYVSADAPEELVLSELEKKGVSEYACFSNQGIPLNLKENSAEAALLRLGQRDSYLTKRRSFFYDKTQSYRLYYASQSFKGKLEDVAGELMSRKIKCGMDSNASYPVLIPIFVLAFAAILLCFAKNKTVYSIGAFYSVWFSACNPFYPVAASLILLLLFIFIMSGLWKRSGVLELVGKSRLFLVVIVAVIMNLLSSSLITAVLFVFYAAGILSALCVYSLIEQARRSRLPFQSVLILPARRIDCFSKSFFVLPLSVLILLLFLIVSVIGSKSPSASGLSKILLPGKAVEQSEELPQLEDYYRWTWEVLSAPYVSINSEAGENPAKAEFPSYEESGGKITRRMTTLLFDDAFRQNSYSQIDSLDFFSLEKILKTEGKDTRFGYVSLNSYSISPLSVIMLLICFFILLFIYISSIIRRGGRK